MLRNVLFVHAVSLTGAAHAATQIELWHAMHGALGEEVEALARRFNASQREVRLKAVYQGGYDQTYSRALSAHFTRSGSHLVQVYEAGSAGLMAWHGAIKPAWQLMAESGARLDPRSLVPAVASTSQQRSR